MSEYNFSRDTITAFHFVDCQFDAETGTARLDYAFDQGGVFSERITFPGAPFALTEQKQQAVTQALRTLHLIAGVSYYKAAVPENIIIDGYSIDAETAEFLTDIYENGLGEFAYRNNLSLRGKIRFPHMPSSDPSATPPSSDPSATPPSSDPSATPPSSDPAGHLLPTGEGKTNALLPLPLGEGWGVGADSEGWGVGADSEGRGVGAIVGLDHHALVAIGGGKDSLVSIESLRRLNIPQTITWIGSAPLIRSCAERTGLPLLNISRQLPTELFEMNKQGALNGHIPVTAVNSAILTLAALLQNANQVVFSNERSASYGSFIEGTGEVNHQWSKGWSFERDFAAHVKRTIAADLHYYSLLRPFSELAVARQFAKTDFYDAHFSSCNRNFHILGERPAQRWCGVCPKCHFVFLALAPFMPKPRLMAIFGRNLLDEKEQVPGFDALLEYQDHKPFECVGEGKESRAAMAALAHSPSWREDFIVQRFAQEILPQLEADDLSIAPLLIASDEHAIPLSIWEPLSAAFRA